MNTILIGMKSFVICFLIGFVQADFIENLNIGLIDGYDWLNSVISFLILSFIALPLVFIAYTPIFNRIYDSKFYKFLLGWQNFVSTVYVITTLVIYDVLSVTFFKNETLNDVTLINSYCILGILIYLIFQTYEKKVDQIMDLRSFTSSIESYKGDKKNNKYHGKGVLMLKGDEKYEGEFLKGQYYGFGTYTYGPESISPGEKYEGFFKNGEKSGKGILTHSDQVLDAYFINGQANGYGEVKFGSGDSFKGEFKDGNKHGYGTYKFANGEIDKGFYKNDIFVERDDD
jgi:hypothetical protein